MCACTCLRLFAVVYVCVRPLACASVTRVYVCVSLCLHRIAFVCVRLFAGVYMYMIAYDCVWLCTFVHVCVCLCMVVPMGV